MHLEETLSWYQRKIGTYDKQQWERTVEQRILLGLTHVPKKTAKLKTELIDLDLVRGSSFPKAKPKHGIGKVTRLAILRLLFLPIYSKWWIQQTSPKIFALLVGLYILQIFNMGLYFSCDIVEEEDRFEHVTTSEVLVPGAMMLVLSIVHSQIVSTHSELSHEPRKHKSRQIRRTKRRSTSSSRNRGLGICSDSKTSQEVSGKVNHGEKPRSRARRSSLDEISQSRLCRSTAKGVFGDTSQKSDDNLLSNISEVDDISDTNELTKSKPKNLFSASLLGDKVEASSSSATSSQAPPKEQSGPNKPEPLQEPEGVPLDDDGFESLNGNASSDNGDEAGGETSDIKDEAKSDVLEAKAGLSCNWNGNASPRTNGLRVDVLDDEQCHTKQIGGVGKSDVKQQCCLEEQDSRSQSSCVSQYCNGWMKKKEDPFSSNNEALRERKLASHYVPGHESDHEQSDTEGSDDAQAARSTVPQVSRERLLTRRKGSQPLKVRIFQPAESSYNSSCESDGELVSPITPAVEFTEGTTSGEWIGVTTNSEDCSYSSELEASDSKLEQGTEFNDHPFAWELSPTVILSPSCAASDKVSCTIWENRDVKKADLSVLDISSSIIARVETMPENLDYFYGGIVMAFVLALLPSLCRLSSCIDAVPDISLQVTDISDITSSLLQKATQALSVMMETALGYTLRERLVVVIAIVERSVLAILFFFLLAVAERTFKQRFLYAKLFSHLTSFRRARKSELPHFRLNKVRNIKTWLSVRSYLKKRGPQRSVDVIVSTAFIITLLLLSFLSVELLKDSVRLHSQYNLEALVWCLVLGFFLLRFMTLGTKINGKYHNLSVLITEQINLYLQIEQKPNKKEELMVANSVLKLAADLLKELESPFKISGLSANPYLYTITKVVILSAFSGVLSEMLGFKLKLHKIKIK